MHSLFIKGGLVMWPLLGLSVLVLALGTNSHLKVML